MNPREDLFDVIFSTLNAAHGTNVAEELTAEVHGSILNWMNRNQIVFYQP